MTPEHTQELLKRSRTVYGPRSYDLPENLRSLADPDLYPSYRTCDLCGIRYLPHQARELVVVNFTKTWNHVVICQDPEACDFRKAVRV